VSEPIIFNAKLDNSDRNLTGGDGEMCVIFVIEQSHVLAARRLFDCGNGLLTLTVRHDAHLPTAIRFRASIPPHKTALGGRKRFKARFDAPLSERVQTARFFDLPDAVFEVEVQKGDKTGEPLTEKESRTKKEPKLRPAKGEHGQFWKEVVAANLFSNQNLMEWLEIKRGQLALPVGTKADDIIRAAFSVSSRTFISPDELLLRLGQDLPKAAYDGLEVTITRAAERAAERRAPEQQPDKEAHE